MSSVSHRIIFADVLDGLRSLPSGSVNCVATSPPYWGLRDYGTGRWRGGDPGCDHVMAPGAATGNKGNVTTVPYRDVCGKCGAVREDGQLGLEATPEAYVARLVEVFGEVRRVLRHDGVCFLNLGDSYSASRSYQVPDTKGRHVGNNMRAVVPPGLKPKDLCGIPWRVAFALQADGWWLRNDIIWAKKNPMPESVTDRFSSTHEHVFLLTKAARYWFDLDAVREELKYPDRTYIQPEGHKTAELSAQGNRTTGGLHDGRETYANPLGKNPGDVWRIATKPTPYAHFATWPPDLVERMILAGCPPKVCAGCGEPWEHRVETVRPAKDAPSYRDPATQSWTQGSAQKEDLGYHPACKCQQWSCKSQPGLVLDPFAGSGTTTQVARKLGRRSIGIELNADYEAVMRDRLGLPEEGTLFGDEALGVEFVALEEAEVL